MDRIELSQQKRAQGYNCAQAVLCAFADDIGVSEDVLFRLIEAFGGGMGGTQGVCGAVSAAVALAGFAKSAGINALPASNKAQSYRTAAAMMHRFDAENGSVLCAQIKSECKVSCDECVASAVKIVEDTLFPR